MKGRIVITGGSGMLSSALQPELEQDYELIVLGHADLDVSDLDSVRAKLIEIEPDILIHTAAMTNVEKCEVEQDLCYKVNAIGTYNLVTALRGKDVKMIYLSSTGAYGTSKSEPYTEFDEVLPTTAHHKSKYEGEKSIQHHLNNFAILRTGWLYGGSVDHPKNFVYQRYLEAGKKDVVFSDNRQSGNPTYVKNLAEQIKIILAHDLIGVFNCIDSGVATRFDYVQEIIRLFEMDCKVEVAPEGYFKRVAPVSLNESAINHKLNLMGLNVMRDWKESLSDYVKVLKAEING